MERVNNITQLPDDEVATLGQIHMEPFWMWAICETPGCLHRTPFALAPFIIRWGPDTTTNRLRRALRCRKCGVKGATIHHPSWENMRIGFEIFPVDWDG